MSAIIIEQSDNAFILDFESVDNLTGVAFDIQRPDGSCGITHDDYIKNYFSKFSDDYYTLLFTQRVELSSDFLLGSSFLPAGDYVVKVKQLVSGGVQNEVLLNINVPSNVFAMPVFDITIAPDVSYMTLTSQNSNNDFYFGDYKVQIESIYESLGMNLDVTLTQDDFDGARLDSNFTLTIPADKFGGSIPDSIYSATVTTDLGSSTRKELVYPTLMAAFDARVLNLDTDNTNIEEVDKLLCSYAKIVALIKASAYNDDGDVIELIYNLKKDLDD